MLEDEEKLAALAPVSGELIRDSSNIVTRLGGLYRVIEKGACCNCNRETDLVDIDFQGFVCSAKCQEELVEAASAIEVKK